MPSRGGLRGAARDGISFGPGQVVKACDTHIEGPVGAVNAGLSQYREREGVLHGRRGQRPRIKNQLVAHALHISAVGPWRMIVGLSL